MSNRVPVSPENCPEPFWHNTHMYCPQCSFVFHSASKFDEDSKEWWKARAEEAEATIYRVRTMCEERLEWSKKLLPPEQIHNPYVIPINDVLVELSFKK
jgi:hypothetical protein